MILMDIEFQAVSSLKQGLERASISSIFLVGTYETWGCCLAREKEALKKQGGERARENVIVYIQKLGFL